MQSLAVSKINCALLTCETNCIPQMDLAPNLSLSMFSTTGDIAEVYFEAKYQIARLNMRQSMGSPWLAAAARTF